MAKPRKVAEQAAEADRLQKELAGDQGAEIKDPPTDKDEKQTELSLVKDGEQPPAEGEKGIADPKAAPTENWEERFKGMKLKYDTTVPELRTQVSELSGKLEIANNQVETLRGQIADLQEKITAEPPAAEQAKIEITEEEREEYGEGLINLIQKVSGQQNTPLEVDLAKQVLDLSSRLDALTQKTEQVTEDRVVDKRGDFFKELTGKCKNWRSINKDPKFLSWLAEEMPGTGQERQYYLDKHFKAFDALRTADLFNDFLAANGTSRSSETDLEEQVQVNTAGGGSVDSGHQPQGKIYTRAEIKQFYKDKREGKYRYNKDDAVRIERDILAATADGRIRD